MTFQEERDKAAEKHCENMRPGSSIPYTQEFKEGWECRVSFEAGASWALKSGSISVMVEALTWAKQMLYARDEMNAKVHCAPLRLSPITERVIMALEAYAQAVKEQK